MKIKYNEKTYEVDNLENIVVDGKKIDPYDVVLLVGKPDDYKLAECDHIDTHVYSGSIEMMVGDIEVFVSLIANGKYYYEARTFYHPGAEGFECYDVEIDDAYALYNGDPIEIELDFDKDLFKADFEFDW